MAITKPRFVSLTFDDGPSPYTTQILDILSTYNIEATFFVVGKAVKKYPEIITRIKKENHVIGNHTWNHPVITGITSLEITEQILKTNSAIKEIIDEEPTIFRPPYGKINNTSYHAIHGLGLTSVLWNVDSLDWFIKEKALIEERIRKYTKSDSIILLHDGDQFGSGPRDATVKSLPGMIEDLIHSGFSFIAIPEFHNRCFIKEKW
ncbi:polysaccharide deacetylase family protein [Bacillus sp. DX4.1]|uniref:polysaccharide deacetylase family protein n=1 Tax=Bacillus sp. DX4.1 TaxID=3055867 RepID=UPI0025A2693B|nr:polysaccharide deacetylase family protein [Bacillus sp. DX4.1]MDM5187519.1 polysaccharide deacetylase family protein [Bacillus sp. DX4.1]